MRTTKGESTNALTGGRSSRSSDEKVVMTLERRGRGTLASKLVNPFGGKSLNDDKPPLLRDRGIMGTRSRMNREVQVRCERLEVQVRGDVSGFSGEQAVQHD